MTHIPDDDEELELTDEDILDAMQHIPGYIDISTEDFRAIYHLAWHHAVERLRGGQRKSTTDDLEGSGHA